MATYIGATLLFVLFLLLLWYGLSTSADLKKERRAHDATQIQLNTERNFARMAKESLEECSARKQKLERVVHVFVKPVAVEAELRFLAEQTAREFAAVIEVQHNQDSAEIPEKILEMATESKRAFWSAHDLAVEVLRFPAVKSYRDLLPKFASEAVVHG